MGGSFNQQSQVRNADFTMRFGGTNISQSSVSFVENMDVLAELSFSFALPALNQLA
jgi:hypothetical protein